MDNFLHSIVLLPCLVLYRPCHPSLATVNTLSSDTNLETVFPVVFDMFRLTSIVGRRGFSKCCCRSGCSTACEVVLVYTRQIRGDVPWVGPGCANR